MGTFVRRLTADELHTVQFASHIFQRGRPMREHRVDLRGLAVVVTTATVSPSKPAFAAEPAVKGPESVKQWYEAGNDFIRQNKRIRDNERKAKNVILFVGDGMGISTIAASRILEGQLKG